jgi:hypothetical protein
MKVRGVFRRVKESLFLVFPDVEVIKTGTQVYTLNFLAKVYEHRGPGGSAYRELPAMARLEIEQLQSSKLTSGFLPEMRLPLKTPPMTLFSRGQVAFEVPPEFESGWSDLFSSEPSDIGYQVAQIPVALCEWAEERNWWSCHREIQELPCMVERGDLFRPPAPDTSDSPTQ